MIDLANMAFDDAKETYWCVIENMLDDYELSDEECDVLRLFWTEGTESEVLNKEIKE